MNCNIMMVGISVNEQLPDTHCDVLVTKKNGRVFQMSYHTPPGGDKRIFQYWGDGQWIDQHSNVTHWTPLPNPAKNTFG